MKLSTNTERRVIEKAIEDKGGPMHEYKESPVNDVVLLPVDLATGAPSSREVAEAKQALYNEVRKNNG